MKDWTHEFDLDSELIYLNHAAVAPWPLRTQHAVEDFARENAHRGAADYPQWLAKEQLLRERLARLINASPEDISLLKNTSEGLSLVAYGLDFSPGDEIVGIADDFPSNRVVWESLASKGVKFRPVRLDPLADDPEAPLLSAITDKTRLLVVSSVHYATGLRLDLERLGQHCRHTGTLFCVDAIQSLGAVPFDVDAIHADFVAADGHKWLLGPEGVALFYTRPAARELLEIHQFGWHNLHDAGNFDHKTWAIASDGRRFECGSPNMLGIHGLEASLAIIEDIGVSTIHHSVLKKIEYLFDLIDDIAEIEAVTPRSSNSHAGIFTFRLARTCDYPALWRWLMDQGVICAHRGGGIRFSPHIHNNTEALAKAIQQVRRYSST